MTPLPDRIRACPIDLDGALTSTAGLHRWAGKQTLGQCLRRRAGDRLGELVSQGRGDHA